MKKIFSLLIFCAGISMNCRQAGAQAPNKRIEEIKSGLEKGDLTVSEVLTRTEWMDLHSMTPFRELVKTNAPTGKIRITPEGEPGMPITVKVRALDRENRPISGALAYYYQTSSRGWYSDTAAHVTTAGSDYGHARLFGYQKTDADGYFEFETIRPEGYPKSDLPAHIHIHFWDADGKKIYGLPEELLFEEDKRLTPGRREDASRSGFLISKNTGTDAAGIYEYRLIRRQ